MLKTKTKLTMRNEIEARLKELAYSKKPIDYRWELNDHIEQTLQALNLDKNDLTIITKNHITSFYDKVDNHLIARVSPNTRDGLHYVFLYPKYSTSSDNTRLIIVNYKGKILSDIDNYEINEYEEFRNNFKRAVKMDMGRVLPKNK